MPSNRMTDPNAGFNRNLFDQQTGRTPVVARTDYWRRFDRDHPGFFSQPYIRLDLERLYPNGPPSGHAFSPDGLVKETLGSKLTGLGKAAIIPAAYLTGGALLGGALGAGTAATAGTGSGVTAGAGGLTDAVASAAPGFVGPVEAGAQLGGASAAVGTAAGASAGIPTWLKRLAQIAVPVATTAIGHQISQNQANAGIPPELRQLLTLAMQRMAQQQPLFEATTTQALRGLPTYAQPPR